MPSIEFYLAQLTAQSPGMEMTVQGARPEYSAAFIAQAVGKIADWQTYHVAMAKHTDDLVSIDEVNRFMEAYAWEHAGRRYPQKSFKRDRTAKTAELAVLFFLNPIHEIDRSAKSCAAFTGINLPDWQSKYDNVRTLVVHELAELTSAAGYQLRLIMQEDAA
jgi:hypothetical protein